MNKAVFALLAVLLAVANAAAADQCTGADAAANPKVAGTPKGLCKTCATDGTGCSECDDATTMSLDTTNKVCKCYATVTTLDGAADANTDGATCKKVDCAANGCADFCDKTDTTAKCYPKLDNTKACKAGWKKTDDNAPATTFTCAKYALTATNCAGTDTMATDDTATAECINTDTAKQLCKDGYYKADSTAAGKVTGQYKCVACLSNCKTCTDGTTCTACNAAYFLASDKKACTACGTNCTACDNDTSCTTCKETTQKWNTEKKACLSAFKTGAGLTLGSVVAVALFSLLF